MSEVAEKAVQLVLAYDQLKEDGARSLPVILSGIEQHIAELRTTIGVPSK